MIWITIGLIVLFIAWFFFTTALIVIVILIDSGGSEMKKPIRCTTHFHACDCREYEFEMMKIENEELKKENEELEQKLKEAKELMDAMASYIHDEGEEGSYCDWYSRWKNKWEIEG